MEQNETGQIKSELDEDQIPQPPRQEYVATIPMEPESRNPGRIEGVISLICAGVSFLFFPLVFGITGIVLGITARRKGAAALGMTGIILSSLFMAVGIALGIWISIFGETPGGVAEGMAGIILN